MFGKSKEELDIEKLSIEATIRLNEMEANDTAKSVASKFLGKNAIFVIATLVIITVIASMYLNAGALTAVVGLISAVVMALIGMLQGITGTADRPEANPLADALQEALAQNRELMTQLTSKDDSMEVEVNDGVVNISKGNSTTKVTK